LKQLERAYPFAFLGSDGHLALSSTLYLRP
jgi:hypothetical protein